MADCSAPAWNAGSVYVGGNLVTHGGASWRAKWWTQGETPGTTGEWGVWERIGTCDGGDPPTDPPSPEAFPVSEAQFNQFFPNRNSFYTYSGLTAALSAYPGFANSGSETIQKREAAAFLANVSHETGGLVHIVEQNTANYPHYCDTSQSYGCPAGNDQYYGRGPIQLSWNFNYKAAGDALGIDLLNNPSLVQNDSADRLEDRALVLEHPERTGHHDAAQRDRQRRRVRRDDPQHQRQHRVQRRKPGSGAEPDRHLPPLHQRAGRRPGRQPLLLIVPGVGWAPRWRPPHSRNHS